jgi:hypothetical protein
MSGGFTTQSTFLAYFPDTAIPGKTLYIEVGRASHGARQVLYIASAQTKVRLDPNGAAQFICAVMTFYAAVATGNAADGVFWHVLVRDITDDDELRVKLAIVQGQPVITLDDESITVAADDLADLRDACWQSRYLAANRGRRRGGMGKLLAERYKQQAQRQDMRQPTRVDPLGDTDGSWWRD